MRWIARLHDGLIVLLAGLAGAGVLVMTVIVVADVLVRAAGFRPPSFTSATVEYLLLYFALFTAPFLARQKAHVSIDAVIARLPPRSRWVAEKAAYAVSVATCLAFASISLRLLVAAIQSGQFDERSIDIPGWLLYAPMPISFLLVAFEFMRYLLGYDRFHQDLTVVKDTV
jgi:C4-dicarboxylate transporter DctQ subunit